MARPGFTSSRKFRRLSFALGSRIVARGVLELLWDACYEAVDDRVGTAQEIEDLVGWDGFGESGGLVRALCEAGQPDQVGFLEPIGVPAGVQTEYRVHDLWDHAPTYVLKRLARQEQRRQLLKPGDKRRPRRHPVAAKAADRGRLAEVKPPPSVQSRTEQSSTEQDTAEQGPAPASSPRERKERPIYDSAVFAVFRWMQREFEQRLELAGKTDFDLCDWYKSVEQDLRRRGESCGTDPYRYLLERLYLDARLPKPSLTGRRRVASAVPRELTAEERAKHLADHQAREQAQTARDAAIAAYLEALPADALAALEEEAREDLRCRAPFFAPQPADVRRAMHLLVNDLYRGRPIPGAGGLSTCSERGPNAAATLRGG
jgi:hypothetical protein